MRTKNKGIKRIDRIDNNKTVNKYLYFTGIEDFEGKEYGIIKTTDIVKHSKQLIDLIEVGDIVNKELVIGIIDITNDKEERVDRKLITQYRSAQFTGLDIRYYIYDDDIKTILTRESYMANCYKVGGE